MKKLIIGTTFVVIGIASFNFPAYSNVSTSKSVNCSSIPIKRPTGGATRERLQMMQQCFTEVKQLTRDSNLGSCPIAEPTGGATRARLQNRQQCNTQIQKFIKQSKPGAYQSTPSVRSSNEAIRGRL